MSCSESWDRGQAGEPGPCRTVSQGPVTRPGAGCTRSKQETRLHHTGARKASSYPKLHRELDHRPLQFIPLFTAREAEAQRRSLGKGGNELKTQVRRLPRHPITPNGRAPHRPEPPPSPPPAGVGVGLPAPEGKQPLPGRGVWELRFLLEFGRPAEAALVQLDWNGWAATPTAGAPGPACSGGTAAHLHVPTRKKRGPLESQGVLVSVCNRFYWPYGTDIKIVLHGAVWAGDMTVTGGM